MRAVDSYMNQGCCEVAGRSEELASTIDRQSRDLDRFLAERSESDLRLPCADPGGSTVGAVLSHLGEGSDIVLGWLEAVVKGGSGSGNGHGPSVPGADEAGHGHDHDSGPADLRAHAERLRRGGQTWAALVRGLSDAQLDQVPPLTKDITDGTKPLAEIMDRMIEHQLIHLDYIRAAVTGQARGSERTA